MTKETVGWVLVAQTERGLLFLNEEKDGLTSNLAKAHYFDQCVFRADSTVALAQVINPGVLPPSYTFTPLQARRIVIRKLELL